MTFGGGYPKVRKRSIDPQSPYHETEPVKPLTQPEMDEAKREAFKILGALAALDAQWRILLESVDYETTGSELSASAIREFVWRMQLEVKSNERAKLVTTDACRAGGVCELVKGHAGPHYSRGVP